MPKKLLTLAIPFFGLILVLQLGCTIDAVPESAVNFVGGSHTITATSDVDPEDEFCDVFDCEEQWLALFLVFAGPDEGVDNVGCGADLETCLLDLFECIALGGEPEECGVDVSGCNPESCLADFSDPIAWTYQNNGASGTDYIAACMGGFEIQAVLKSEQQRVVQPGDDLSDLDLPGLIAFFEGLGCDVVTKTWLQAPEPPKRTGASIGPVLAGADAERRARENTQAVAGVQQAIGEIRPPNTGDAGLR